MFAGVRSVQVAGYLKPNPFPTTAAHVSVSGDDSGLPLGPEGGDGGGEIIAQGTPEDVAQSSRSFTGRYLAPLLGVSKKRVAGGGK